MGEVGESGRDREGRIGPKMFWDGRHVKPRCGLGRGGEEGVVFKPTVGRRDKFGD